MPRERPTTRRHPPRVKDQPRLRSSRRAGPGSSHLAEAQISVGNFLRSAREALQLTQAEVARKTYGSSWQLSRAAISAIERGQNFPGLEAMLALSNVLHIDPKELIERARLTAVVPVDLTGSSDRELESRAGQYFWAGDFKRALAVYDAMVQKLALEAPEREEAVSRLATLELRRATALKRIGALISAIASIERAISLSVEAPAIQAQAYVVLADLQAQRGHLPLARDAAARAIELARESNPRCLVWAHIVQGQALHLAREFAAAKQAFLEARRLAEAHDDRQHLSHIAGNIGSCCRSLGDAVEARDWIERAVGFARAQGQPALEASWLVELGRLALEREDYAEADRLAGAALELARPREHNLTVFRAEWLRHRVRRSVDPRDPDPERLERLSELFRLFDGHEGIDEIVEYRENARATKEM